MLQKRIFKTFNLFSSQKFVSLMNNSEKLQYLNLLQQNAQVEYKQYPALPHQNPNSPQYIHSELDQYHDRVQVQSYNAIINDFKHDLKVQREVWNSLSNLDRPYKRGIRGIDTNLSPDGVPPLQLQDLGFQRRDMETMQPIIFPNEDRFIANTPFNQKNHFKHITQWQKQRLNRPVTKTFNQKGYKYDVLLKPQEKYEYLADRLGHPQFLGTPVDRLFKLQNDIFHPCYLDQPFIKMPSFKPCPSLNFQQGQVIYENTRVLQWIKFVQLTGLVGGAYFALFVPFNLVFKTNLVTDTADQLLFLQYHLSSPTMVDIMHLSVPIGAGAIAYTVYGLMNLINHHTSQYVIKMSYSKDKQLVFVKRVDLHGTLYEQVYQMAHLQILPPNQRSGVGDLSSQDDDGLWRVSCLNKGKRFLLYNDKDHWNINLRTQFFQRTLNLWDKSYYGYNRTQQEQINRQWRQQAQKQFTQQKLPGI